MSLRKRESLRARRERERAKKEKKLCVRRRRSLSAPGRRARWRRRRRALLATALISQSAAFPRPTLPPSHPHSSSPQLVVQASSRPPAIQTPRKQERTQSPPASKTLVQRSISPGPTHTQQQQHQQAAMLGLQPSAARAAGSSIGAAASSVVPPASSSSSALRSAGRATTSGSDVGADHRCEQQQARQRMPGRSARRHLRYVFVASGAEREERGRERERLTHPATATARPIQNKHPTTASCPRSRRGAGRPWSPRTSPSGAARMRSASP